MAELKEYNFLLLKPDMKQWFLSFRLKKYHEVVFLLFLFVANIDFHISLISYCCVTKLHNPLLVTRRSVKNNGVHSEQLLLFFWFLEKEIWNKESLKSRAARQDSSSCF
jgi:hypothetical protein